MVAIGLAAVASVAAPALADSTSGKERINNAQEHAGDHGACGLGLAESMVGGEGSLCLA
jgi:hypothetical protein